jgi:hypothetical protein
MNRRGPRARGRRKRYEIGVGDTQHAAITKPQGLAAPAGGIEGDRVGMSAAIVGPPGGAGKGKATGRGVRQASGEKGTGTFLTCVHGVKSICISNVSISS